MKEHDLGRGNKIIGFSSMEEMAAYMAEAEARVAEQMKHLTPEQSGISFGSYALRLIPVGDDVNDTLVIFGRVYSYAEVELLELASGADPLHGELRTIMERFNRLHADGYRYGRWFSNVCPEGEVGDAHVTTLWPITEADYQHALNNSWECPAYLLTRVLDEMAQHIPGEE